MTQPTRKRQSRHRDPAFQAEVLALRQQGLAIRAIAERTGSNYAAVNRALQAVSMNGNNPITTLQRVEVVGEPSSAEPVQSSAEQLLDHETRLQVLESFVASLQAQVVHPPVQHITVQSSADSAYALHSAESVQTWDDPEDAKPERWNLWLPRGLKRRIEAHAKAAGIAPSQLVQRLLMAALPRPEGEQ
jgi:hypothetical protein